MNTKALIAIALAALLVFAGGAAALPGNAPADPGSDAADDHAPEDPGEGNETDADDDVNETDTDEEARDENASEGPPTDMPEQVPDHVTTIHQLIRDKLNGDLGNTTLGEAISGVVGGEDAADEQSENADVESENASENADQRSGQASENGRAANAGVAGDLPEQAADHVGAIHDAIASFLNGDGGTPGDAVSSAAQG